MTFTFYSYKGGTGRSMALANFACWLGRRLTPSSRRVLLMDWDLEAPGLHRYFATVDRHDTGVRPGLIDYFESIRVRLDGQPALVRAISGGQGAQAMREEFAIEKYITPEVAPGVDLLMAGRLDVNYPQIVSGFNWVQFYGRYPEIFRALREALGHDYEYCLIDSRTGFNDTSGICTMLMPEKLVLVFTPNRQNLSGVIDLTARAVNYRRSADDFRPLSVFPLPSRIENAEQELKEKWRRQYQREFEAVLKDIYQLDECDLTKYFDEVVLPHVSFYAYGEELALLREQHRDTLSLSRAYDTVFRKLHEMDVVWDDTRDLVKDGIAQLADSPSKIDRTTTDIFISYAHIDDQPLFAGSGGWVRAFHSVLEIRLRQLLGNDVNIWRDEKLRGNDAFAEATAHQTRNATVFIPILSPGYVRSEFCRREMESFLAVAEGRDLSALFKVVKTPIPVEEEPAALREYLGYRFYGIDEVGRPREFGYAQAGLEGDRRFMQTIDDLASDIVRVLSRDQLARGRQEAGRAKRLVYLAETSSDLEDIRGRVKRELQQYGYGVLPDRELPKSADAFRAAVRELLARCVLSVHLIGESYGIIPEGEEERSVVRLQEELAAERARSEASFSRLIWMPTALEPRDERQRRFLRDVESGVEAGDDLLRTTVEDLKMRVLARLEMATRSGPTVSEDRSAGYVYLMCENEDARALEGIRAYLFAHGCEVVTSLGEDESMRAARLHRESLIDCDAVLIYYGAGDDRWLRSRVWDLRRARGWGRTKTLLASAVLIGDPLTREKETFATHEVMMVLDGVSRAPEEALRPFLERVEEGMARRGT